MRIHRYGICGWIGAKKYHAASRVWELCGEDTVSYNDTFGEAAPV